LKKKPRAQILISPAPEGWRLLRGGGEVPVVFPSLEDAAADIANGTNEITLALPVESVLLERMQFPSTDPDELRGMMHLQLEKTLPYPSDEVTEDFFVVSQSTGGSVVLAAALQTRVLDELCTPLRARQLLPGRVGVYAARAAAACPANRLVLLLYKEQNQIVVAVVEKGKLGYAQTVPAAGAQMLGAELPQLLLTAEMEGVPSEFSLVCLDRACADLAPILGPLLGVPVEKVDLESEPQAHKNFDLVPSDWIHERRRFQRRERLRLQLARAGAAIMAIVALAAGYIVWLQVRVNRLDRQLLRLRPELETVRLREARWNAMGPAIDPARYPVEILFQIFRSLPSENVRITLFSQRLDDFTVEGEAPSAGEAIEFIDKLRQNPELQSYTFEAGPPAILQNDHAKFRVFATR
jgi:hypothetical protein